MDAEKRAPGQHVGSDEMLDIETAVILWRLLDADDIDERNPDSAYVSVLVKLAEEAMEEMENPYAREMLRLKLRRLAGREPRRGSHWPKQ